MIIVIFIFGLIVGSFLNAVIYRLHSGESIVFKRSHCPDCGHDLSALDLVPVLSFIFLRGKCRYCGKSISWQYPIIELITAVIFVLLALNYGLRITDYGLWLQFVVACFFIIIAVFDLKHYLILDKIIFPLLALVIMFNLYQANFLYPLLSGLGISGFFLLQYLFSKGRWIGFGDVKFGLVLGNLAGWPQSILLLMLAYFIGAFVGIILIVFGKKHFGSRLPFGVFLSLSAVIVMLYGNQITSWYLRLIGFA